MVLMLRVPRKCNKPLHQTCEQDDARVRCDLASWVLQPKGLKQSRGTANAIYTQFAAKQNGKAAQTVAKTGHVTRSVNQTHPAFAFVIHNCYNCLSAACTCSYTVTDSEAFDSLRKPYLLVQLVNASLWDRGSRRLHLPGSPT